jgi:hypothetical protein
MSKNKWLILLLFLLLVAMFQSRVTSGKSQTLPDKPELTLIEKIKNWLAPKVEINKEEIVLALELMPVCSCESTGSPYNKPRQFNNDGSVRYGRQNPLDTGMCQINKKWWLSKAIKLGYDIETEEGNILMANWIYKHEGLKPWSWSKSCWQNVGIGILTSDPFLTHN